jgi:hypothetical protein
MPRPKGFVLSAEQKAKMQAGRARAKAGLAPLEKPVKEKIPKEDRPKRVMSEEHKAAIKAGRALAKANGKVRKSKKNAEPVEVDMLVNGKRVLKLSGKEKTCFDFMDKVRREHRRRQDYVNYKPIVDRLYASAKINRWQDVSFLKEILSNYYVLK